MSMDSFSSQLVLSAAKEDANLGADLYKAFSQNSEGAPSKEQRNWVEQNIGKTVYIELVNLKGTIVRLNESSCGLEPGGRYPAVIQREDGHTFPYGLEHLKIVEE